MDINQARERINYLDTYIKEAQQMLLRVQGNVAATQECNNNINMAMNEKNGLIMQLNSMQGSQQQPQVQQQMQSQMYQPQVQQQQMYQQQPTQSYQQQPIQTNSMYSNMQPATGPAETTTTQTSGSKYNNRTHTINTPQQQPLEVVTAPIVEYTPADGHEFPPFLIPNTSCEKEYIGTEYKYTLKGYPMSLNLLNRTKVLSADDIDYVVAPEGTLGRPGDIIRPYLLHKAIEDKHDILVMDANLSTEYIVNNEDRGIIKDVLNDSTSIAIVYDKLKTYLERKHKNIGSQTYDSLNQVNDSMSAYVINMNKHVVNTEINIENFYEDYAELVSLYDDLPTELVQNIGINIGKHFDIVKGITNDDGSDIVDSDYEGAIVSGEVIVTRQAVMVIADNALGNIFYEQLNDGTKRIDSKQSYELFELLNDVKSKSKYFEVTNNIVIYTSVGETFSCTYNLYKQYYTVRKL